MDTAHRDRLAFVRVCSGRLRARHGRHPRRHRPAVRHQVRPGRSSAASAPPSTAAFPGDVVGLVNANALRVGDTPLRRRAGRPSRRSRSFAPEHFAVARAKDSGRYKQFRRGIEQLDQEGVVQVLRSRPARRPGAGARRGRPDAVRGRAEHRMADEFGAPVTPGAPRLLPGPAHRPRLRAGAERPAFGARSSAAATASCWPSSATAGGCSRSSASCPTPCWRPSSSRCDRRRSGGLAIRPEVWPRTTPR